MKVLRTEKIPHFHISLLKMMTYIRKEKEKHCLRKVLFLTESYISVKSLSQIQSIHIL